MKAKNKLQFRSIRGIVNEATGNELLIVGRQKSKMNDMIIATYSKTKGLTSEFDLASILTEPQQKKFGDLIDQFHPEGGFKR